MGISNLLDISRRSLGVYQQALSVTAHNITNANNPDYSRQEVVLGTERAVQNNGEFGAGVKMEDVLRIKNNLTETQINAYNQKYADSDKRSLVLGQMESLLSEPSDLGLSNLVSSFFNSWDKLAVNTGSVPLRNSVLDAAEKMSNKFQSVYEGFDQVKSNIKEEANEKVGDLNNTLKDIQTLNKQIFEAQLSGNSPSDLLDSRDKKISDLSSMANISVSYDDKGYANVSIGGIFAVDGFNITKFKLSDENGKMSLVTEDGSAKAALNGGSLFAMTDLYSNSIPNYQKNIDSLATAIKDSVNTLHSGASGVDFFTDYSGGKLVINQNIQQDVSLIATSTTGQSGQNDIALAIAQLSKGKVLNGQTISENYSAMVSKIGAEKQSSEKSSASNKLVLDQLGQQKASYSGVSVDEEMTNIIKFQRSYDASAKLIKISDEMLQTLINMV